MRISWCHSAIAVACIALPTAGRLDAQIFEAVGTRAQGMGGAFVAVADDATATWWNPAGLATGAIVNAIVEHGRLTEPNDTSGHVPAAQTTPSGFAVGFPALGVSYYRLHISQLRPLGLAGRVAVRAVTLSQLGVTVGQSLGSHLVVGSTLKLLRSGAAAGVADAADPLGSANALDVPQTHQGDLDVGVMATLGQLRLGLSLKNVTAPDFGAEAGGVKLARQGRLGVAFLTPGGGAPHSLALAFDADLTRTPSIVGDVRHVAGGAEAWLSQRTAVRGGLTANTIGDSRLSYSGGLSFALAKGMYIDVSRVWGSDETLRAWSTAFRLSF